MPSIFSWPDFTLLLSDEYANGTWIIGTLAPACAYGIGEEAGWRGSVIQDNSAALI